MDEQRYIQRLLLCWCFLYLLLVLQCIVQLSVALSESKTIDYIRADCLVTDSSLNECGVHNSKTGFRQCYRLQWAIQYVQYADDKQAKMTIDQYPLKKNTHRKDELLKYLKNYQIGQIYPCYHSPKKRSTDVQWEKPDKTKYTQAMTFGKVLLGLSVGLALPTIFFIATVACGFRCRCLNLQCCAGSRTQTDRVRDTVRTGEQHVVLIPQEADRPPPFPLDEENIPFTPAPPAYVASGDTMEPPPYESSSISVEDENIPITPL